MKRFVLIFCLLASPVWAVLPDEILSDPVLEARARELSKELRCLVCRNETIDDSHADLARDLRLLVRERLVAGDTNEQALDYIVDRYGEYVLLRPTDTGSNLILWIAGPLMLLGGLGISAIYLNGRQKKLPPVGLSDEEEERLREILKD